MGGILGKEGGVDLEKEGYDPPYQLWVCLIDITGCLTDRKLIDGLQVVWQIEGCLIDRRLSHSLVGGGIKLEGR